MKQPATIGPARAHPLRFDRPKPANLLRCRRTEARKRMEKCLAGPHKFSGKVSARVSPNAVHKDFRRSGGKLEQSEMMGCAACRIPMEGGSIRRTLPRSSSCACPAGSTRCSASISRTRSGGTSFPGRRPRVGTDRGARPDRRRSLGAIGERRDGPDVIGPLIGGWIRAVECAQSSLDRGERIIRMVLQPGA